MGQLAIYLFVTHIYDFYLDKENTPDIRSTPLLILELGDSPSCGQHKQTQDRIGFCPADRMKSIGQSRPNVTCYSMNQV